MSPFWILLDRGGEW